MDAVATPAEVGEPANRANLADLAWRTNRAAAALYLAVMGMQALREGDNPAGWADDGLCWLAHLVQAHTETMHALAEGAPQIGRQAWRWGHDGGDPLLRRTAAADSGREESARCCK
jgi:hypothetical protein